MLTTKGLPASLSNMVSRQITSLAKALPPWGIHPQHHRFDVVGLARLTQRLGRGF